MQFVVVLGALACMSVSDGPTEKSELLWQAPQVAALYLGARIAKKQGDKMAEASYVQQLRRRYPEAPETKLVLEER